MLLYGGELSTHEGSRDPRAGTSDAPPGREMQAGRGAQGAPGEETAWSTAPFPADILLIPIGPRYGGDASPTANHTPS